MLRLRGGWPSPRNTLAAARPHRVIGDTPSQWLWLPKRLSMWGNATFGDCVSAEEAFAKACSNPEIFITDATLLAWATRHNVLNGADLFTVMSMMQRGGFRQRGNIYNDGLPDAVDWTDAAILQNAISKGPVKLGVAAGQLDAAIPGDPPANGWLATGFQRDTNQDHCTSLCGFGTIAWLLTQLGGTLPDNVDGSRPGWGFFTWGSVGVIDTPSLLAITGEAWLRQPTTIISSLQAQRTGIAS